MITGLRRVHFPGVGMRGVGSVDGRGLRAGNKGAGRKGGRRLLGWIVCWDQEVRGDEGVRECS